MTADHLRLLHTLCRTVQGLTRTQIPPDAMTFVSELSTDCIIEDSGRRPGDCAQGYRANVVSTGSRTEDHVRSLGSSIFVPVCDVFEDGRRECYTCNAVFH